MSAPVSSGIHPGHTDQGLRLKFPSSTTFLSPTRLLVTRWLTFVNAPVDGWDVIITELLTNAINASPADSEIEIEVTCVDDRISCQVSNGGHWNHPGLPGDTAPDLMSIGRALERADGDRGRGLVLISQLSDGTAVHQNNGRTSVAAWRNY